MQIPTPTFKLYTARKSYYLFSLLVTSLIIFTQISAEGYIAKRYTVRQIVSESTHVVFGTVSEVNTKRKTAKIKVEENLKGKSEFQEIKIRLDVYKGEKDHREEAIGLMRKGEPIIVFYLKAGRRIDSLAHTRGKWFQTQVTRPRDKDWGWWLFTHLEVYLK